MKPNPDDRRDNVEKLQVNISNTIENMHRAEEMIEKTSDEKMKETLKEKNKRREKTLEGLRSEIREEALARERGYK
ncbi:MAG: small acid-soluble spore protein Tlp [Clostridiales bacterium]|jgi:small acid-soluble spore protein (thioredoxin-like protein)|nr:small acid-soluble spore protein Tlp [Clostridiales bacterium]